MFCTVLDLSFAWGCPAQRWRLFDIAYMYVCIHVVLGRPELGCTRWMGTLHLNYTAPAAKHSCYFTTERLCPIHRTMGSAALGRTGGPTASTQGTHTNIKQTSHNIARHTHTLSHLSLCLSLSLSLSESESLSLWVWISLVSLSLSPFLTHTRGWLYVFQCSKLLT